MRIQELFFRGILENGWQQRRKQEYQNFSTTVFSGTSISLRIKVQKQIFIIHTQIQKVSRISISTLMISSFTKQSKLFFRSIDSLSRSQLLSSTSTSTLPVSILYSLIYYSIILSLIYLYLPIAFQQKSASSYLTTTTQSSLKLIVGKHINITFNNSNRSLNFKNQSQIQNNLIITDGLQQAQAKFINSTWTFEQIQLQSGIIQIGYHQNQIIKEAEFDEFNLSIYSLQQGKQIQFISIKFPFNKMNTVLDISTDVSVLYKMRGYFSFDVLQQTIGTLQPLKYSFKPRNSTTSFIPLIRISSQQISHHKMQSQHTIVDSVGNIFSFVLVCYFLTMMFITPSYQNKNYLDLASRFFVTKIRDSNNQITYQNISSSDLISIGNNSSPQICDHLKNKIILKMKQKLNISFIIKKLKNIQSLVDNNQLKISNQNLKYTITTINPYDINKNVKEKILEYMKMENLSTQYSNKTIFKSPLIASIMHKLTHDDDLFFLEEEDIELPQNLILKQQTKNRTTAKFFKLLDSFTQKLDIFSHNISFYFEENSSSAKSSFAGFLFCLKIWLFLLISYSIILDFITHRKNLYKSTFYQEDRDCSRSILYQPFYLYVQNSTSGNFLNLSQISNIASISYNIKNKSYALGQILVPPSLKDASNIWNSRPGGVISTNPVLLTCDNVSSFLEIEYSCPSNIKCSENLYQISNLNFYLLFPETQFLSSSSKITHQLSPFHFKYQHKQRTARQNIKLFYEQTQNNYDQSIFPQNSLLKNTYKLEVSQSSINYTSEETPATHVYLNLSPKIHQNKTKIIQIMQFIGALSTVWFALSILIDTIIKFTRKLQMTKQMIQNRQVKWIEILTNIISRAKISRKQIRKIESQQKEYSIQRIIQKIDIFQNFLHTGQNTSNQILLNTYLKQELKAKPKIISPVSIEHLSQISISSLLFHQKNQNIKVHHKTNHGFPSIVKQLSSVLNKFNIFHKRQQIHLNFKGKGQISSNLTKVCSLIFISVAILIVGASIISYQNQQQMYEFNAHKHGGINNQVMNNFQFCVQFSTDIQNQALQEPNLDRYFRMELVQQDNSFKMIKTENNSYRYCVEQVFKKTNLKSSAPWTFSIRSASQSFNEDSEHFFSLIRMLSYEICLTNYYHKSYKQALVFNKMQCLNNLYFKQRVMEVVKTDLQWNIINGTAFYNYNWKNSQYQYIHKSQINQYPEQKIVEQNINIEDKHNDFYAQYTFQYTKGKQQIIITKNAMALVKTILGVITIMILLVPFGRKYNQTTFILQLSSQLFLVDGTLQYFGFLDIIKVMILSIFKFRIFMNKRNRVLMRCYLQTRQHLSLKRVFQSIASVQNRLKSQADPKFSILLKTHIRPQVFLECNIDKVKFKNKLLIISELRQLHPKLYGRLKQLQLNNDEILVLLSMLQNKNGEQNEEKRRRIKYFQKLLGLA